MSRPRILLIHGLNNNLDSFQPLKEALIKRGYETHLICLPGHGEDRSENETFKKASECFEKSVHSYMHGPYVVVAFSLGALYFQLLMRKKSISLPLAQVLLAPALFIRRYSVIKRLLPLFPQKFRISSQMPKILRRHEYVFIQEYRNLLEGIHHFAKVPSAFAVPTKILIDPKDELVDAKKMKTEFPRHTTLIERPSLRGRPGKHHIVFHPNYFKQEQWDDLIDQIVNFINSEA